MELGNRFKRSLGLYPAGAIREAIVEKRVFGAFQSGTLVGYVLFDLPRSDIRLVHLCVARGYRKSGIARQLVDEIQIKYPDRDGIRLKCRRDYEAHSVWKRLGFEAQSLAEGRGRDRAEMVVWWRGFGQTDLFASALEDDDRVQAVLDTNVVMDVVLGRNPLTRDFLDAPGLDGEVVFCVTRSVKNELSETKDGAERRRLMESLAQFQTLKGDIGVCDDLTEELSSEVGPSKLEQDPSLLSDTRILAESIVAGASVMMTNDEKAAVVLRRIGQRHGVDVLHPSQLIVKIDELRGVREDAPDRIQNTSVLLARGTAGMDRELDHLISTHRGETKASFRRLLRGGGASDVRTVHTAESNLADGLIVMRVVDDSLLVEVLRVRRSPLAATLFKQLMFQLRHQALVVGTPRIVITDPHPGGGISVEKDLFDDGARIVTGNWNYEVVDAQLDLDELRRGSVGAWNWEPWITTLTSTAEGFAKLERDLWPLKIRDAPLRSYVIPIRHVYASELLGHDAPLLNRSDSLGISRRHVYYKSPRFRPMSPGRILWYVSGRHGGSIVAASQLLSVHLASPKTLHSRFQKYGVWNLSDVEGAARDGRAVALQFGETEVFHHPVKLSEADAIVNSYGNKLGTVPTVRAVADEAFHEIYGRGMTR
ncbi:hypothetical protein M707_16165 [Arthrobacter sp. AK-YN10]|uniref:GNAT family N-acetyltransferase n=1 Tax=Paenarthrobacter ureafaciens TaxID=37931 RepID=UPI0005A4D800|nr:GNAT family N-acetyltransferase [Paenarthrobacter ureafaciens]ERI36617.2 hypothetical protein M707_16165 [Arthrobacter sp. AK-YN10]MCY0973842.1 GNAT family N-acetyltransferase [Paenarthrobacter ureafaciens]